MDNEAVPESLQSQAWSERKGIRGLVANESRLKGHPGAPPQKPSLHVWESQSYLWQCVHGLFEVHCNSRVCAVFFPKVLDSGCSNYRCGIRAHLRLGVLGLFGTTEY